MIKIQEYRVYVEKFGFDAAQVIDEKEFEIDQLKLIIKMHEQRIEFLERLYDIQTK